MLTDQETQERLTITAETSAAAGGGGEATDATDPKPKKVITFPSGSWYETADNTNESTEFRGRPYIRLDVYEIKRDPSTNLPATGTESFEEGPIGQQALREGIDGTFDLFNSNMGRAFLGASIGASLGLGTASVGAIVLDAATGSRVSNTAINAVNQFMGKAFGTTEGLGTTIKNRLKNFSTRRNIDSAAEYLILPAPDNIGISYDHQYQEIGLTNALGLIGMLGQAARTRSEGENGVAGAKTDPYVMEMVSGLATRIPTIGTGAEKVLLFGTTGLAVNPQLEMIFTSTALRKFMLDFTLTPRNAVDSEALQTILSKLRYYSAPEIPETLSGRYFIPPAQFQVTFYKGNNEENKNFFKSKKCVLQSINVDFMPNGYSTHADGTPTQIRLQLTFIETSILSRADYDQGGGTGGIFK